MRKVFLAGEARSSASFAAWISYFCKMCQAISPKGIQMLRPCSRFPLLSSAFGPDCWKTFIAGSIAKQETNPKSDGKRVALFLRCLSHRIASIG